MDSISTAECMTNLWTIIIWGSLWRPHTQISRAFQGFQSMLNVAGFPAAARRRHGTCVRPVVLYRIVALEGQPVFRDRFEIIALHPTGSRRDPRAYECRANRIARRLHQHLRAG